MTRGESVPEAMFQSLFDIGSGRRDKSDDPVIRELDAIGWAPTEPKRLDGETGAQYEERRKLFGQQYARVIKAAMNSSQYKRLQRADPEAVAKTRGTTVKAARQWLADQRIDLIRRRTSAVTRMLNQRLRGRGAGRQGL